MDWEPRIVAFCCNWCSYAGADLAGVSRFQYPPNVRIVRVMCSGRVEPHFILNTLRAGADGVLVTGCHPGDCHYISGNERARERVDRVHLILDNLGIEHERLGLEWISASEGQRFARTITDFVERIRRLGPNRFTRDEGAENAPDAGEVGDGSTAYRYCIECNKCASSCPITRVDFDYSPSTGSFLASIVGPRDEATLPRIWDCFTCGMCSQRCPSGVEYELLVREDRARAWAAGDTGRCAHGESLGIVSELQTEAGLEQDRLGWLTDDLRTSEEGDILYFVGCLPYFEHALFDEPGDGSGRSKVGYGALAIARSTIAVLNRAGITPVVLPDERCCGHDPLWTGDGEKFKRLASINIESIRRSGAKQVVLSCAEGYRTLKLDYPRYFGQLGFEVLHTSELFERLIGEGRLTPDRPVPEVVVYQDPCRLGRHAQVFEAPRNVLASIPGLELVEFDSSRRDATCCGGPNGWINCGQRTRQIQFQKFKEALSKGAGTIVTACPKCAIHFKCATDSRLPDELEKDPLEIKDLSILLDLATGGERP